MNRNKIYKNKLELELGENKSEEEEEFDEHRFIDYTNSLNKNFKQPKFVELVELRTAELGIPSGISKNIIGLFENDKFIWKDVKIAWNGISYRGYTAIINRNDGSHCSLDFKKDDKIIFSVGKSFNLHNKDKYGLWEICEIRKAFISALDIENCIIDRKKEYESKKNL